MTWEELKQRGSPHYKNGDIEPIDLYRSLGILRGFAIGSIIKYAARNAGNQRPEDDPVRNKDMEKIKHYADMLTVACGEVEE